MLVELAELLAIPVLESAAFCVNFPGDHPLHCGYQFTTTGQNPVLAEADVILVVDSQVPWIPATNRPAPGAAIYAIDVDPLKPTIPMWQRSKSSAMTRFSSSAAVPPGTPRAAAPARRPTGSPWRHAFRPATRDTIWPPRDRHPRAGRQPVARARRRPGDLARDPIRLRGRRHPGCDAGMRLETFSYLPELSADQLTRSDPLDLARRLVVGIEFSAAPDPYDHYWTMWKLPLFDSDDPAAVLAELDACGRPPGRVHQGQRLRPGAPGPGRLVRRCTAATGDVMPRPIMLSIAGDSGSGKTTITRGRRARARRRQGHPFLRRRLPPLRPAAASRARDHAARPGVQLPRRPDPRPEAPAA